MRAASTWFRAISLGVFCREDPSTRAIIRSRKLSPKAGGDPDHDPVGEHLRAPGDRGPVTAGLADHGCGLAGDGGLIDAGHPLDDVAVAGDDLAGLDDDQVADPQLGPGDGLLTAVGQQ